jgi:uncharacterized protein YjlB
MSFMIGLEEMKKAFENATGFATPKDEEFGRLVRKGKPRTFHFKDDGFIPNHPIWPLLLYPSIVRFPDNRDPAAVLESLFDRNGWGRSWRDGVYDFIHYHSQTHEVLAVARGKARLQFGGPKGRIVEVKAGDVAVLPAGTGHQCLGASDDFLAVGAYPPDGIYDECKNVEQRKAAKETIRKTARPASDPVHGIEGPLLTLWKKTSQRRGRTAR